MISTAAEYAVRAMLCLAARAPRRAASAGPTAAGRCASSAAVTRQDIAQHAGLPGPYLAKVLQTLVRARLVRSQRGLNGGFSLARPADQITVLDVVRAVGSTRRFGGCPLARPRADTASSPLHRRLSIAAAVVEQLLAGASLAQLIDESRRDDPAHDIAIKP